MAQSNAAERMAAATGYLVLKVGDAAREAIDAGLAQWELTGREFRVLGLADTGSHSQQDLCRIAGLDRTTMVGVVDRLEHLGYVRRERSNDDRRKYLIEVTSAGAGVLRHGFRKLDRVEAEFLAPLTVAERRQFTLFLGRLFRAHDPSCRPE